MAGNRIDIVRDIGRAIPDPATTDPRPVGSTAEQGTSNEFSRSDHVHPGDADKGWWAFLTLATQSAGLSVGSQVKFDTVKRSGFSSTFLDTTTNIGRFTLPPFKTFKLKASLRGVCNDPNSVILYAFYNVTSSTFVGVDGYVPAVTHASWLCITGSAEAILTPTQDTEIELRFKDIGGVSNLDGNMCRCSIEQIRDEDT
ncbi:MAG: hypothetical protein MJE63_10355 [Proteobacteria bacterium]|nr:hypothetical protein [Pseudomonadota bacterium]